MPKIAVNDVELYYEFQGPPGAPLVVFVNGLLTDTTSWNRHLPFFTPRYRTLVYDCRGQGHSSKPDQPYETRLHIADLAALIEALDIERAHFVGLSNGGATALAYAADHPERVALVVTCGAYAWVETILRVKLTSWIRAMETGGSPLRFDVATPWIWGGGYLENNYEGLLSFREKGVNMPIEWAMNLIKGAMIHDIRDKLGAIKAPTLLLVGEEDVLTPPRYSQQIAAAVPGAEFRIMPGVGHAAALEDVVGFSNIALDFIAAANDQPDPNQTAPEPFAKTTNLREGFVQANDLLIHFIEHGAGTPVVFIHGNWATANWWEPTLNRLPAGYQGITYDMRGRGTTQGPDNNYTMPEMAADLRALLDTLALERVHLVGHSLGSAVAMQFALESPERVLTLTALSPAWVDGMPAALNVPAAQQAIKDDPALFARALKAQAPTAPDDEFWQSLVTASHKQRIEAALRNLPALMDWKPSDSLGETGVPALVISGELDALTGGANAQRAAQALNAKYVEIPGVGHSPNLEAPDRFGALLVEQLNVTRDA